MVHVSLLGLTGVLAFGSILQRSKRTPKPKVFSDDEYLVHGSPSRRAGTPGLKGKVRQLSLKRSLRGVQLSLGLQAQLQTKTNLHAGPFIDQQGSLFSCGIYEAL